MSNALSIAISGLKAEEFYIDKIANDLANLNTPNYKANKLIFEDVLEQGGREKVRGHDASIKVGLGTAVYKSSKDFSLGPLKTTSNWNDVAINGVGFFQVVHHDGSLVYSRGSSLTIDKENYLATQDGLRLADNIQIPEEFTQLTIHANGDVEALLSDEKEPLLLGTIQLAKFTNPERLDPLGNGTYASTEESGEPLIDNPGNSGLGPLVQNQIEGSNVDMMTSLMQLTMAQRIYQLNAKALQTADELERLTNEIRD